MGFLDRVLLGLYTLAIIILLLLAVTAFTGWWLQPLDAMLYAPYGAGDNIILWLIIGVLLLVSLRLFYVSLVGSREKRAVVHEFTLGQLRITIPAIEGLVKKAAFQIDGVREVKPRINTVKDGVSVFVKVTVAPDINIPETSKQIQQRIKDYLLEITGISVHNVKVMVENISTNKPRVE
ncbi:alkaline shock response membrane anchor protein AmaP [Desulfofalx alkaliphila]|uniref:alkaline shock response membrane anchor protein AmaP n=1 Tax=Desulfofalx alkaliphila TaxID=105483 RepID=UPI0004E17E4C|nr:alkaline shock response membrane anchor protein AmaP [Desulfofalx alkaliphila]